MSSIEQQLEQLEQLAISALRGRFSEQFAAECELSKFAQPPSMKVIRQVLKMKEEVGLEKSLLLSLALYGRIDLGQAVTELTPSARDVEMSESPPIRLSIAPPTSTSPGLSLETAYESAPKSTATKSLQVHTGNFLEYLIRQRDSLVSCLKGVSHRRQRSLERLLRILSKLEQDYEEGRNFLWERAEARCLAVLRAKLIRKRKSIVALIALVLYGDERQLAWVLESTEGEGEGEQEAEDEDEQEEDVNVFYAGHTAYYFLHKLHTSIFAMGDAEVRDLSETQLDRLTFDYPAPTSFRLLPILPTEAMSNDDVIHECVMYFATEKEEASIKLIENEPSKNLFQVPEVYAASFADMSMSLTPLGIGDHSSIPSSSRVHLHAHRYEQAILTDLPVNATLTSNSPEVSADLHAVRHKISLAMNFMSHFEPQMYLLNDTDNYNSWVDEDPKLDRPWGWKWERGNGLATALMEDVDARVQSWITQIVQMND